VDSCGQPLPNRDTLLPKVKALRKVLQEADICKKVCLPCSSPKFFNARAIERFICAKSLYHYHLIHHQTPQSRDLVYYKFVEWMQASFRVHYSDLASHTCLVSLHSPFINHAHHRLTLSECLRRLSTHLLGASRFTRQTSLSHCSLY
jgi:hypothetical protein